MEIVSHEEILRKPLLLTFGQISEIRLEHLLNDRILQRDIHYTLEKATYNEDAHMLLGTPYNPNPILGFENAAATGRIITRTFTIKDPDNIYFFQNGWPIHDVPDCLRTHDIVPSGLYEDQDVFSGCTKEEGNMGDASNYPAGLSDIPFNKPLMRVNTYGGQPERYNSLCMEWETFDNSVYRPSLVERIKFFCRDKLPVRTL